MKPTEKFENETAEWLSTIIESSFDGIYITDEKANTILVNKSYESITGLSREEMLDRNMQDLLDAGVISCSGTLLVLKTGEPVTLHQEFKTGKQALITSTPVYDHHQKIAMVITNVRDLSEIYSLKVELRRQEKQNTLLMQELEHIRNQTQKLDIVVEDEKTLKAMHLADRVKDLDTTVILTGETGVGKEVFAKYIHQQSSRREHSFIKVNCGAIPENLIESELFGYEKGAFTGAERHGKPGLFEVANKGTLFLDEIGELPLPMQVKLLRVLQEQEITRVGGIHPIKVDVRIIAATNQDLEEMVREKLFRQELYYRLMVFPIHIPPLRERKADIPVLAKTFLSALNQKYHQNKALSDNALELLTDYPWPGNIRELKNVVERAFIICMEDTIDMTSLSIIAPRAEIDMRQERFEEPEEVDDLPAYLESVEYRFIKRAYEKYGNVRDAAKSLGISPATLIRKKNRQEAEEKA